MRAGLPRAWFGGRLEPGVVGFVVGNRMMLGPVPPGRTLWTNRNSPIVLGRIVPRRDGGFELRLAFYSRGFPYSVIEDPPAMAFLNDWIDAAARELGMP
jgi:hypothetical protein